MQLVAAVLQRGLSALVLVPEITLISQIERRFRARFGDCVALLHSGLSSGERYDQWIRIVPEKPPSPSVPDQRFLYLSPVLESSLWMKNMIHLTSKIIIFGIMPEILPW